jgi:peptidoglycan/LPS O-acetylase OafA/YrhL
MQRHLPGLDGVRAIAVLMVVTGHALRFPTAPEFAKPMLEVNIAYLGVNIFFVLSGFLITTLLIGEHARTGRVSPRDFYARRTIRIFPAAYAYMAVVAVAAWAGVAVLRPGDMLHALTYTTNYHHDRGYALGHLWSLAVEEQFYLLWPLVFMLMGRRALAAALLVLALAPVVRTLSWVVFPDVRQGIDEEFQFVCDSLATGCALALVADRVGLARLGAMVPGWLAVLAPVATLCAARFMDWPSFHLPLGATLINIGIATTILWVVTHPSGPPGRLLNSRAAVFVGSISYSLYLWQQLFLDRDALVGMPSLPTRLLLVVVAAAASYYLLERPLMALRARLRH